MNDANLSLKLVALTVGMFFFGFALVPLYAIFCDVTGFGGKTSDVPSEFVERADSTRSLRVEFVAALGPLAPWEFKPTVSSIEVHPGRFYEVEFYARNLTESPIVGQAVPSVAPGSAARYFQKVECFCFTQQAFDPAEARDMKVVFSIAPALPEHIDTLTLAYTFYAVGR